MGFGKSRDIIITPDGALLKQRMYGDLLSDHIKAHYLSIHGVAVIERRGRSREPKPLAGATTCCSKAYCIASEDVVVVGVVKSPNDEVFAHKECALMRMDRVEPPSS